MLPTVYTLKELTNITQTSVTCGGKTTSYGGAGITEKGICYSLAKNPTTADIKVICGKDTGSFTANLTGLTVFANYYIRAYAINSAGTAYGDEIVARGENFICQRPDYWAEGWVGATTYDPLKTGIHPIIYYSNPILPQQWQTSTTSLVELIVCDLIESNQSSMCTYSGGQIINRYSQKVSLSIRSAKTGKTIASNTFQSKPPAPCPQTYKSMTIYGEIDYIEINNWLQNYVVK